MSNILIVAAHPDDEVLGCGATAAKKSREGRSISCVFLGDGVSSRYDSPDQVPQDVLTKRRDEAREAADILGIDDLTFGTFPDNRFDSVDLLDLVKFVEQSIDQYQPDVVYTHHSEDLNIDHRLTHEAALTALRPISDNAVGSLYAFEVLSSTEWRFGRSEDSFSPQRFIDVENTFEKKVNALKAYRSETNTFPHPRSPEAVEALAKRRGAQSGVKRAEAFGVIRKVES